MAIVAVVGMVLILILMNLQASSDTLWTAKYIHASQHKEAAYYEAASACNSIIPYIKANNPENMSVSDFYSAMNSIQMLYSEKIDTGTSKISIEIYDAESRFPLNSCTDDIHIGMFTRLLENIGIDNSYAGSVADWIDSDTEPRTDGSEESYSGREAKNNPLDSLEELKSIYGMRDAIEAYASTHEGGFDNLKLYMYANPNNEQDMNKININTASSVVIKSLSSDLTDQDVVNIQAARPIEDMEALISIAGNNMDNESVNELNNLVKFKSSLFIIKATSEYMEDTSSVTMLLDSTGNILSWKVD